MANQEHVDMLRQGVEVWDQWRRVRSENQDTHIATPQGIDLRKANLRGADLREANLRGANFSAANLRSINFSEAVLSNANLQRAFLGGATMEEEFLRAVYSQGNYRTSAGLREVDLREVDLSGADFTGTDFTGANLSRANLQEADLSRANLRGADLSTVDLSQARMGHTILVDLDLHLVKGLAEIQHLLPSYIELSTVKLPMDGSALHFLRGVGVPDEWINFYRTTMMHPIQYHSLFISYASKDGTLARRLHADLQDHGVRCWFAPEDMKIGDKIRVRIDEAIHLQDKLLLLLSEHAIASTWVEDEVEAALEKEQRQQREVLFPIRLDEKVMQTSQAWAAKLRRTRHIGDFTRWKEHEEYQKGLTRLLRDLKQDAIKDEA